MITENDIRGIAKLSCLEVREQEIPKIKSDMEHILGFTQIVCNYDFDALSQSENMAFPCALREDNAESSYSSRQMLSNAPLHKDGYILLRKSE